MDYAVSQPGFSKNVFVFTYVRRENIHDPLKLMPKSPLFHTELFIKL